MSHNYVEVVRTSRLTNGTAYYSIRGLKPVGDTTPTDGDIVVGGLAMPNFDGTTDLNEAIAVATDFAARHGLTVKTM